MQRTHIIFLIQKPGLFLAVDLWPGESTEKDTWEDGGACVYFTTNDTIVFGRLKRNLQALRRHWECI